MALHSKLFTEESPGKAVLKRCSETHAGHLFRGMPTNLAIQDAIARVQEALGRLGIGISDPKGVYGAATEAAVLLFKGPPRNILGPGQTKPDGIVGIQTIHTLDAGISGGGPSPKPLEFGSTNWRFGFFGNKPAFGKGVYTLFIASEEVQDSKNFSMSEGVVTGTLIGGFKGETRGRFQTERKMHVTDFNGASSRLFIDKKTRFLSGFLQLTLSNPRLITVLKFALFEEERVLGGSLTTGDLIVDGAIR